MLSITEAAKKLGVSRQTISNWGEREILTLIRVGKAIYVDEQSVKNVKKKAPNLTKRMNAIEQLEEELDRTLQKYMSEIKEYKLEMMMRKDSVQRIHLYMEIFASLTDLIYEGRYDEKEYKIVIAFLKGHSIKDIAEEWSLSGQTVVNHIRKVNEILFNLQPYIKLQEENREHIRKQKLQEKELKITRAILETHQSNNVVIPKELSTSKIGLYLTPVDNLDLSLKSKNLLRSGGWEYLGDIVHYSERELMKIRGFGHMAFDEVKNMMDEYNLRIGQRIPGWESIVRAMENKQPTNFAEERLYENMDDETNEYLDTMLQGLPEEQKNDIKQVFQKMFTAKEKNRQELEKHQEICQGLRQEIVTMEKRLRNEVFYLPAYEEVKALFKQIERSKKWKEYEKNNHQQSSQAIGILDCIFNQEALQAESRQMKSKQTQIRELEKNIKKLETKLALKSQKQPQAQAKPTNIPRVEAETPKGDEEALKAEIRIMKKEMEVLQTQNKFLETCAHADSSSNSLNKLKKLAFSQEQEIKQLRFEKKSRDLTIEYLSKGEKGTYIQLLEAEKKRYAELENAEAQLRAELENAEAQLRAELQEYKQKLDETEKKLVDEIESKKNIPTFDDTAKILEDIYNAKLDSMRSQHNSELNSLKWEHKKEVRTLQQEQEEQIKVLKLEQEHEIWQTSQKHSKEVENLWNVLHSYEDQVDAFNDENWFSKMRKKLEKFSDQKTKTLTQHTLEAES